MDKLITLCFECRCLMKEHYDLEVYQSKMMPLVKCENCGKKYDLLVCRVKTKKEE